MLFSSLSCLKVFRRINLVKKYCTSSQLVLASEGNGVRRVTLNNPKKRNALSLDMLEQLSEHMFENLDNISIRCILLGSSGPIFSSGHDLKELRMSSKEEREKVFQKCTELMLGIRKAPVPVIAEVRGLAAAAGCQLVASCDIVIASQHASFSTPGASVGLFCSTPGVAVSRAVPQKMAAYMLFTGNTISAEEALHSGLVSKIALDEEINAVTNDTIQAILSKSRSVIELGKKFYYKQLQQGIEDAYRDGSQVMVENLAKSDSQEGISAFFEKRKPVWTHT